MPLEAIQGSFNRYLNCNENLANWNLSRGQAPLTVDPQCMSYFMLQLGYSRLIQIANRSAPLRLFNYDFELLMSGNTSTRNRRAIAKPDCIQIKFTCESITYQSGDWIDFRLSAKMIHKVTHSRCLPRAAQWLGNYESTCRPFFRWLWHQNALSLSFFFREQYVPPYAMDSINYSYAADIAQS